jgi:hypothetical protein
MGFLREGEALLRETEDAFTLATNLNIQATISQLEGDEERTEAVLGRASGSHPRCATVGRWSTG